MSPVFRKTHKRIAHSPTSAQREAADQEERFEDYEYPKVSIVIPTYNCATSLDLTLDRILLQHYPDFEIIIVDASSTDGTLELVQGYRESRITICTVSSYHRSEMLNKGISQASGSYINFLFPGDYYIYRETLKFMMTLALDHRNPNLVFCGTLLRDGKNEPEILFRHLSLKMLRKGMQPTTLQSCWFRADTFSIVGKFDNDYSQRSAYELMCRFCLTGNLRAVSVRRILIDYDRRMVTRKAVATHFQETYRVMVEHFGIFATIRWLFFQRDWIRLMRIWWRNLKASIVGS